MTEWVEAIPQNAYVRHAVRADSVVEGSPFIRFGRAACGVAGRDGWGGGGMRPVRVNGGTVPFAATDPNPDSKTTWDNKQMNEWCPRCIRVLKRESAS